MVRCDLFFFIGSWALENGYAQGFSGTWRWAWIVLSHPGYGRIVRRSTLLMPAMVDHWLDEWPAVMRHCTPVSRALLLAAARASTSSVLANDAGERSSGIAGTNATMLTLCCASLRCELHCAWPGIYLAVNPVLFRVIGRIANVRAQVHIAAICCAAPSCSVL